MKKAFLLSVLASIFAILPVVSADGEGGCGMMSGGFGIVGMLFGWVFGLLVLTVLVLLVVWLIKQIQKK